MPDCQTQVEMLVRESDFDSTVRLPPGLEIPAIRRAIEYIERKLSEEEFIQIYHEQANVFSAIVGIFGTSALDSVSSYQKNRDTALAQTRFPDLHRRGARPPFQPADSLESKASMRSYAIQSHYDHAGWYIVWRYLVDPTETIQEGRPVIIWRVDVVFLNKEDWKYNGSRAGSVGGGRTHTFGIKQPAKKLRGTAIYKRSGIVIRGGKHIPVNGNSTGD